MPHSPCTTTTVTADKGTGLPLRILPLPALPESTHFNENRNIYRLITGLPHLVFLLEHLALPGVTRYVCCLLRNLRT